MPPPQPKALLCACVGFFWFMFYQQCHTPIQENAWQRVRLGPTAPEPYTASKRRGVGLGAMLDPKCHRFVGHNTGAWTQPAWGHTLTHHRQAAPSSTAAHGETKSPFCDARMKEAFYKDFRACSPSGLYVFFNRPNGFKIFPLN